MSNFLKIKGANSGRGPLLQEAQMEPGMEKVAARAEGRSGAGDGIRTRDVHLGRMALYH